MKNIALRRSIFLPFILTSFFLLLPNVKAEEISGVISTEHFDYNSDNSYTDLKNYIDDYMQQNDLSYYIIYYDSNIYTGAVNFNNIIAKVYDSLPSYTFTDYGNRLLLYSSTTPFKSFHKEKNNSIIYQFSNTAFNNINFWFNTDGITYRLIDTNIDFVYTGSYSYIFNSSFGSYTLSNNVNLKGLLEISNLTPSDNTPILTEFYSVVGSKIGWLGEQFMDSYIYIAIFGVFIFIFLIELIRRYFL